MNIFNNTVKTNQFNSHELYANFNKSEILGEIFSYVVGNESLYRVNKEWNQISKQVFENKAVVFADKEKKILKNETLKPGENVSDISHDTLLRACEYSDVATVKLLLSDRRVNPSTNKSSALKVACNGGKMEIVNLLLKDGRSDVDTVLKQLLVDDDNFEKEMKVLFDNLSDEEVPEEMQKEFNHKLQKNKMDRAYSYGWRNQIREAIKLLENHQINIENSNSNSNQISKNDNHHEKNIEKLKKIFQTFKNKFNHKK